MGGEATPATPENVPPDRSAARGGLPAARRQRAVEGALGPPCGAGRSQARAGQERRPGPVGGTRASNAEPLGLSAQLRFLRLPSIFVC